MKPLLLLFSLAVLFPVLPVPFAWAQAPSADPLQQIDAKRRELQVKQVIERGRLLTDLQRTATAKGDLKSVNALQALLDEARVRLKQLDNLESAPVSAAASARDANYHEGLQGRVWKGRGDPTDFELSFEGDTAVFKYTDGKISRYQTEVVWPGLLRFTHPSRQTSYLAFDEKGKSGAFMMYTSQYPGTLMTSKGD